MRPKVFVSFVYNPDLAAFQTIAELLERIGFEVLSYQKEEHSIKRGGEILEALARAIHRSQLFVVLVSTQSLSSRWVRKELEIAKHAQKEGALRILPVVATDVEAIYAHLAPKEYGSSEAECVVDDDTNDSFLQFVHDRYHFVASPGFPQSDLRRIAFEIGVEFNQCSHWSLIASAGEERKATWFIRRICEEFEQTCSLHTNLSLENRLGVFRQLDQLRSLLLENAEFGSLEDTHRYVHVLTNQLESFTSQRLYFLNLLRANLQLAIWQQRGADVLLNDELTQCNLAFSRLAKHELAEKHAFVGMGLTFLELRHFESAELAFMRAMEFDETDHDVICGLIQAMHYNAKEIPCELRRQFYFGASADSQLDIDLLLVLEFYRSAPRLTNGEQPISVAGLKTANPSRNALAQVIGEQSREFGLAWAVGRIDEIFMTTESDLRDGIVARLCMAHGQFSEAANLLNAVVTRSEVAAQRVLSDLILCLLKSGDVAGARSVATKLLTDDPSGDGTAECYRGLAKLVVGEPKKAIQTFQRVAESFERYVDYWSLREYASEKRSQCSRDV